MLEASLGPAGADLGAALVSERAALSCLQPVCRETVSLSYRVWLAGGRLVGGSSNFWRKDTVERFFLWCTASLGSVL